MFRHGPPESPLDRLAGALLAGLFVALTLGLLPFAIAIFTQPVWYTVPRSSSRLFVVYVPWWLALTGASVVAGFILGSGRAIELLGHLWGTYQPRNPRLTAGLWAGVAIVGVSVFATAFPWPQFVRWFGWTAGH